MIVVTVELHSAVTQEVTLLGKLVIANDGTSPEPTTGHYHAFFGRRKQADVRRVMAMPMRKARILNFLRLRLGVWHLIRKALEEAGY